MFVQSFHMFLDKDEERDLCIDLDAVCHFIGMRKDQAKRVLVKHFNEGTGFAPQSVEQSHSGRGGHNVERVLMTPDTFKELCMMAGTAKGREVRSYYIKMEKVMKAYFKDKMTAHAASEARLQLELADERASAEAARAAADAAKAIADAEKAALAEELEKHQAKTYEPVPKVDNVYIFKEVAEMSNARHKIGKAFDPVKRRDQLNTGSAQGIVERHRRPTHNAYLVETIVKVVMKRYHYSGEHYMCEERFSKAVIDVAATVVDTLASCYESISRTDMIQHVMDELQALGCGDEASHEAIASTRSVAPRAAAPPRPAPPASTSAELVAQWLRERVHVTQSKHDFVLLGELKRRYYAERRPDAVPGDMFIRLAAAYLVSVGGRHTKAGDKIPTADGGRRSASHIVRFAKYAV